MTMAFGMCLKTCSVTGACKPLKFFTGKLLAKPLATGEVALKA